MIEEFDHQPIFYFTNHHSIQGPGDVRCMPDHFEKLDFELEAAIALEEAALEQERVVFIEKETELTHVIF